MESNCQRRMFFKKVGVLAGVLLATPFLGNLNAENTLSKGESRDDNLLPRINPAFRMYCHRDGSVKLYTFQKSAPEISYSYSGLEVSLLLLIACNKPIKANQQKVATLHSLSYSTCKKRTVNALNEFKSKGLIY
jgi:hypothetical protein